MSKEKVSIRLIRCNSELEYLFEYTDEKRKLYFYATIEADLDSNTLSYEIGTLMKNEGKHPIMYFDTGTANLIKRNIASFFETFDVHGQPLTAGTRSSVTFSYALTR